MSFIPPNDSYCNTLHILGYLRNYNTMQEYDKVLEISLAHETQSLKETVRTLTEPRLFKGCLLNRSEWTKPLKWTPEYIAESAPTVSTSFKIGKKEWLLPTCERPHFETDCRFVQGTLSEFVTWITQNSSKETLPRDVMSSSADCDVSRSKRVKITNSESELQESDTSLSSYPPSEYWGYCDYKYMFQLFQDTPSLLSALDWSGLGFEKRGGEQSTIWIGSELAHTPCHYDTYGYNIVAQLYGCKRWYLVSPTEHDKMYPTRIPYEESSVFSPVNLAYPNYTTHPNLKGAAVLQVVMNPGDILYVPKHWWHFVICVDTTVSVNTWIELESDSQDRLREAITRIMVFSLKASDEDTSVWLNPKEEFSLTEDNCSYLENAMREICVAKKQKYSDQNETGNNILLQVLTQKNVVDIISQELLNAIKMEK